MDILAFLKLKELASNVYTKQEIHDVDISFTRSLNTKSDKVNTCLSYDVDVCLSIM